MHKYDLLVIGSGPGGQRAAIQAAKLGKNAAIVERRNIVGGVTTHTGTIPSKTLRETVLHLSGMRQRQFYGKGYRAKANITIDDLLHRLRATINQQIEVIQDQLTRNGVTLINGTASFIDAETIRVVDDNDNEARYQAGHFVIATGTTPRRPDHIPFDDEIIIDSDGILGIKKIPRTLALVGAGVIGVEYATIFSALDTKVTLIDSRPTILDFVDTDNRRTFVGVLKASLKNPHQAQQIEQLQLQTGHENQHEEIVVDARIVGLPSTPGVSGTMISCRVITEHVASLKELRASEARFSRIFHSSPDAILIVQQHDATILDFNTGFSRLLGYTREQAIGQPESDLHLWVDDAERKRIFSMLSSQRECTDVETRSPRLIEQKEMRKESVCIFD